MPVKAQDLEATSFQAKVKLGQACVICRAIEPHNGRHQVAGDDRAEEQIRTEGSVVAVHVTPRQDYELAVITEVSGKGLQHVNQDQLLHRQQV